MSGLEIVKEYTFDCAHMLSGHKGECKNLHGHTYLLQVGVSSKQGVLEEGPSKGMILDFKDLKVAVKERIVDKFDHAYVMWSWGNAIEREIGNVLLKNGRKVVEVPYRPTAENMAVAFYNELYSAMLEHNVEVTMVRVWETKTSYAEVRK